MSRLTMVPILLAIALLVVPTDVVAQVFHLPPARLKLASTPLPTLSVRLVPGASATQGTDTNVEQQTGDPAPASAGTRDLELKIVGNQLLFMHDGEPQRIPLADITAEELAEQLRAHKAGFQVRIERPELPAAWLVEGLHTLTSNGFDVLHANPRAISLHTGFGGVLAPGRGDAEDGGALLEGAGVHFNIIGTAHLHDFGRADHDLRFRFGLALDEAVSVESASTNSATVSDLLQKATQLSATISYDRHLAHLNDNFRLVASTELSGAWNRFSGSIDFVEGVDEEDAENARAYFRRVEPTKTVGLTLLGVGYDQYDYSFYGGLGLLSHEVLVRNTRLSLGPGDDGGEDERCFGTVCALLRGDQQTVWRAVVGANLGGLFDLRMDAVGGFDRAAIDPLVRLLLIKPFTVLPDDG